MFRRQLADTRPLREPHFRRLWVANIVTVIGAQLSIVAVPQQVFQITGSSAYVGLTGVFPCRSSCSGSGAGRWPTRWTGASC